MTSFRYEEIKYMLTVHETARYVLILQDFFPFHINMRNHLVICRKMCYN